jgi:hypothetical protein
LPKSIASRKKPPPPFLRKSGGGVQRVDSEPTVDADGHQALHITIVLQKVSTDKMGGDSALDTLVGIAKALRKAKQERFPIISYVTEEELEESDGDSES